MSVGKPNGRYLTADPSYRKKTFFADAMFRVSAYPDIRITEHLGSRPKVDAMLPDIEAFLLRIPDKTSLPISCEEDIIHMEDKQYFCMEVYTF